MSIDMAMFAMVGSLVGASATVATAWLTPDPGLRGDVKPIPDETLTLR